MNLNFSNIFRAQQKKKKKTIKPVSNTNKVLQFYISQEKHVLMLSLESF